MVSISSMEPVQNLAKVFQGEEIDRAMLAPVAGVDGAIGGVDQRLAIRQPHQRRADAVMDRGAVHTKAPE